MLNRDEAVILSEAVDDDRPLPAESSDSVRAEFTRQLRVDDLLRSSAPRLAQSSPAGLADRINAAIADTQPDHLLVLRRVGPAPFFAAAAALLLAGITWFSIANKPPATGIMGSGLPFLPAADPTQALNDSIESPLAEEARNLREDTRRATDAVLAYLPLSR